MAHRACLRGAHALQVAPGYIGYREETHMGDRNDGAQNLLVFGGIALAVIVVIMVLVVA